MIDSWTLLTIGQVAAQVGSQYSKCGKTARLIVYINLSTGDKKQTTKVMTKNVKKWDGS